MSSTMFGGRAGATAQPAPRTARLRPHHSRDVTAVACPSLLQNGASCGPLRIRADFLRCPGRGRRFPPRNVSTMMRFRMATRSGKWEFGFPLAPLGARLAVACGVRDPGTGTGSAPVELPPTAPRADGGHPPGDPAAPPVAGLEIAGVFVPRERIVVLLHVGHSNMAGRGERPAELRPYFYEPHP